MKKNYNFYTLFSKVMMQYPTNMAIESENGMAATYGELAQKVSIYAAKLLSYDLNSGDRVLVQVSKSPEALVLYLACLQIGVVYIPLNTAYSSDEVLYFIEDSEPKIFVGDTCSQEILQVLATKIDESRLVLIDDFKSGKRKTSSNCKIALKNTTDVAVLIYTSGTTGRSKGAMLTHGNLTDNALALVKLWGFSVNDVVLHSLPIFHIHGLFVALNCALIVGAKLLWQNKFEAGKVVKELPKVTVFMGVPTYYSRLLREQKLNKDRCKKMRLFISGSAPLTVEAHRAFLKRTGHIILERYGMSEAGIITSNPLDGDRLEGTVGFPLDSYDLRIVGDSDELLKSGEIGNIQIRGPSLFPGYWRMPEKTRENFTQDGWFETGDLGLIDSTGRRSIVGRSKDMIISGGYNVYPKEIEQLVEKIAQIDEVAVVGVPHHDLGEAVIAVIVTIKNQNISDTQIIEYLGNSLANYKIPKLVYKVKQLPKNAMGKIQKNRIREELKRFPEIVALREKK